MSYYRGVCKERIDCYNNTLFIYIKKKEWVGTNSLFCKMPWNQGIASSRLTWTRSFQNHLRLQLKVFATHKTFCYESPRSPLNSPWNPADWRNQSTPWLCIQSLSWISSCTLWAHRREKDSCSWPSFRRVAAIWCCAFPLCRRTKPALERIKIISLGNKAKYITFEPKYSILNKKHCICHWNVNTGSNRGKTEGS